MNRKVKYSLKYFSYEIMTEGGEVGGRILTFPHLVWINHWNLTNWALAGMGWCGCPWLWKLVKLSLSYKYFYISYKYFYISQKLLHFTSLYFTQSICIRTNLLCERSVSKSNIPECVKTVKSIWASFERSESWASVVCFAGRVQCSDGCRSAARGDLTT